MGVELEPKLSAVYEMIITFPALTLNVPVCDVHEENVPEEMLPIITFHIVTSREVTYGSIQVPGEAAATTPHLQSNTNML